MHARIVKEEKQFFGIAELDDKIALSNAIWLISGAAGSGKTLVSTHFANNGAEQNEPVVYVTVNQSPQRIAKMFAQHWPALEQLLKQKKMAILDPSPYFTQFRTLQKKEKINRRSAWDELWDFTQDLVKQCNDIYAKRIILDPVTPLFLGYATEVELWDMAQTFLQSLENIAESSTIITHIQNEHPRYQLIGATLESLCHGSLHICVNHTEHSEFIIQIHKARAYIHNYAPIHITQDPHMRLLNAHSITVKI